jgi:hypothetical protein
MCFYCVTHRQLYQAKQDRDVETLVNIAEKLGNRAISAEFDRDYCENILNGTWPNAKEILERALKKMDKKGHT